MPECEYYDDQYALPRNEELVKVRLESPGASKTFSSSSKSSSPQDPRYDPGLAVLTGSQNLIFRFNVEAPSKPRRTASSSMPEMTDKADEPPLAGEASAEHQTASNAPKPHDDAASNESSTTQGVHVKPLKSIEAQSDPNIASKQLASRTRADSMQAEASTSTQEKPPPRSGLASPLKLKTSDSGVTAPAGLRRESISSSPTLSKHTIHGAVEQNLAPFEPPSPSAASPQAERLPSIHQLTSTLTELAEAATQELPRQQAFTHNHRQSFGSAAAQSPVLSNHPYPASVQTSPQAYFPPVMARSPTSTLGESPAYASPPAYPGFGPYGHRRPSMADGMPPMIPTLHSASSSGESGGGYHSSGTEGYSTNHTTPIDVGQVSENAPRPLLPPPPGMHALPPAPAPMMVQGLYKCDVPNCTAGTFQTQYLLNSHKNVHSQSRPHYCPVAGCSRAEGGKGFKRKNEMIRHGLVHNSPGYICPFCPEREHRYPRPDNLQRHVRVHHVDKDRDDEALRDVLNQRSEGQGKTRRRRTNTVTAVAAA